jgi:hypothetical protein
MARRGLKRAKRVLPIWLIGSPADVARGNTSVGYRNWDVEKASADIQHNSLILIILYPDLRRPHGNWENSVRLIAHNKSAPYSPVLPHSPQNEYCAESLS